MAQIIRPTIGEGNLENDMKSRAKSGFIGAVLTVLPWCGLAQLPPPVNYNCLTNQPGLTVTCPGYVPDLCALAAPCFSTNYIPGSCTQNFPPGFLLSVGSYSLTLQVQDLSSNVFNYAVPFVVLAQVPTPNLTVMCPTNKTVECGSGWSFDAPVVLTACCGVSITTTDNLISNSVCSQVITRTWQILDGCGNLKTCSQTVTTQDTTPPGSQCGQNLVPNPSFEQFTNCPNSISMFDLAAPWFTPSDATTDLYSPCAGVASYVGTPTNLVGVQMPMSGQCYAGAVVWSVYGLNTNNTYRNYREYLEVPLLATLTGGQKYQVSFYVSRADKYRYAIAELGACLTKLPLTGFGTYTNFNVVPQVENPSTNILASTNSWMLVQGTFTAVGNENYLTIGNFRTDIATTYATFPPGPVPDYAYYYFDDVSVIAICDPVTNKTVQCGQPWTFDNVTPFDSCSGNNVTATITTTTNGYCPQVFTRTWSLADACGNSNTLTQTVTIVDTNPPVLLCAAGANLAPNPQFENFAWCPFGYSQLAAAGPWFSPTIATPDYLNSCTSFAPVSTPANNFGSQAPFSGQGYAGAFVYAAGVTNIVAPGGYREYIEAPLLAPLVAGVTYQVSFRVSLADNSAWAISEIGAHFSSGAISTNYGQGVLSYVPQVVNPSGTPLASTNSWMLVQGAFTAAGGEDYITLGNFLTDSNTTAVAALGGTNSAYYFYDDISVTALCNGSFTNKTVQCGTAWMFDEPAAFDTCSGNFLATSDLSTTSSGACPEVVTRVWLITDNCNNSITATQVVTVVDTQPPVRLCSGVNLIPNPSFEDLRQCPQGTSRLEEAWPWYSPTDGSSDLFNPCAPVFSGSSAPTNMFGSQTAFTGVGYGGGFAYFGGGATTNSYREYLQSPLLMPLIAGQAYAVSFWVNRADDYDAAISSLGAYFSAGPATNYGGQSYMANIPQVTNPPANFITSTTSWTQVSGVYVASGGEDHITLGNFNTDANTPFVLLGANPASYYYYDEVSVVALCTNVPFKTVACGGTWSFDPAPIGVDRCSGSNVTVTVASTVTNGVCPRVATRTWLLTDLCGNTNTWAQAVTFVDIIPATLDCNCLQTSAASLLTTNACAGIVPNLCQFTNCFTGPCGLVTWAQTPPAGTIVGPGNHPITVAVTDCAGGTSVCVLMFHVSGPGAGLTLLCASNKTVQCGMAWAFDPPAASTTCCSNNNVTVSVVSTVTTGICPPVITRTYQAVDACGNTASCSQVVTVLDTNPPIATCAGTNLVTNGNFESYAPCPNAFAELSFAAPWFAPTGASPDYFNACAPVGSGVSVPVNSAGVQAALSGQGYGGAILDTTDGNDFTNSYREYIAAPLAAPLVAGQSYLVSFHVNLADFSSLAIAEIGAHFSVGPVTNYGIQTCLPVVPQVVNPPNNLLASTNAWMPVQGIFTASGGENYITLGNFLSEIDTTSVPAPGPSTFAYYYFDDVSVVALCTPADHMVVQCGEPWSFDVPAGFDACSGTNVTVTLVGTVTNGVCPKVITRTWLLVDLCGNTNTWSQTVFIVDNTPPAIAPCAAPNLVPNPSFESYTSCPTNPSNLGEAAPWYAPSDGTSDFFNACATAGSGASVPTNFPGVQNAFSGQGYGGAFLYQPGGANATNSYREYLQTPLLAPLVAGQSYTVSFYVNRSDLHGYAIAEIGAHLSVGPMTNYTGPGAPVFQVVPQVENSSTNLLTSTNSWMLVQGTFTAAGGENYLTLGNFRSDANTTAVLGSGLYSIYAYYYFDKVSVTVNCAATNKIVPCGGPFIFDTPAGVDLCSGTNVTVSVVNTITNSVCPLSITRTWALADLCGNTNLWSQTVSGTTNSPPVVDCGCLQDYAIPLLTTNGCAGIVPNLSVLINSSCISNSCGVLTITQSPAAGTVVGGGSHNVTIFISNCNGTTNTCVLPFNVNPPQPVLNCPTNLYFLTCNTGLVVNYLVTATGNNGNIVCSPPSGSVFPLGTNVVICTATNNCGGVAVNGFYVIVRPQTARWSCLIASIGVIVTLPPTWQLVHLPDFPGGGAGVNFENLNASIPADVRLDFGPAQKITFSTVLDFNAPAGATFALALPPDSSHPNGTTLLNFQRSCAPHCGWNLTLNKQMVADSTAVFRSIAIGTNGKLFSSFTHAGASLDTNILASLMPMDGATNAQMTVTLDCRTREVTLAFPSCTWTPDAARKGWDACIYGNRPSRGSTGNKTARLILTPVTPVTSAPITMLDLVASNLTQIAFDNPSITASGRKWSDGHVTLMKAYDDGANAGMEFFSLGNGGGVRADLGHAASFQFHIAQFQDGTLPNQSQLFRIKGWPPGTTTNRPPPPVFNLRLAQNPNLGGVDCFADFSQWGVSQVTVQLWNGTALVGETNHVPASLTNALVTMSDFPGTIGCPGIGVVSLVSTNPFVVFSGLNCSGTMGCVGTELRILAELSTMSTPPTAFTELDCLISDGMDNLIYGMQTTPACSPVPLNATTTPAGISLNWQGDGFRLQGAESVSGPWYDLGADSPVNLPANYALRFFRLVCD